MLNFAVPVRQTSTRAPLPDLNLDLLKGRNLGARHLRRVPVVPGGAVLIPCHPVDSRLELQGVKLKAHFTQDVLNCFAFPICRGLFNDISGYQSLT